MPVQTQMQVRRGTASSWTSTNPTLAAGELGFETNTGKFKIGNGSSTWTALLYAGGGQSSLTTYQYTATAGQTTFSGADANGNTLAYTVGAIQVYLNGALLANTTDYAATNGTSVVLTGGAGLGDSLTIISFATFDVANTYTQAQADALFIPDSIVDAKGDIIAATAADTVSRLAVGANDTVLTADSSTATGLKWAAPSSGSMTLLSTTSLSSATTTVSSINGTYNDLYIMVQFTPASDASCSFKFNANTLEHGWVSAYITTATTTPTQYSNAGQTNCNLIGGTSIGSSFGPSMVFIYIKNYANQIISTNNPSKVYDWILTGTSTAGNSIVEDGGGRYGSGSAAVTSFSMITSAASFSSGSIKIYGVK